ncbi:gp53-like domain-containing protein [Escherichia albertii]|nr:hypothetical protein FYK18_11160 [Escherichia albertii]
MHRIDTKTAQKDKFGAGKNGFTRGNPQTGTPATDLDDDYFDMLQEELCSVVEASGASLEKAQHDQLLTALRALLLSRKNPFGDIKSDGTVQTALENLGLGEAAKRNVGTEGNQIPSMSEWTSGAGWNRDPSGRIIQRGFAMASNQTNILFPIPFPYDDFEVIVCAADTGTNKGAVNVLQKSRQGFSVSQVGSMPVAYRWIAG